MTRDERNTLIRERYDEQRQSFIEMLGGQCVKCGAYDGLQFDHIDPKLKAFEISEYIGRAALATLLRELAKCQLLCRQCHDVKSGAEYSARRHVFRHGTVYAWMKKKCRCSVCVAAKWAWHDVRNSSRRSEGRRRNITQRQNGP